MPEFVIEEVAEEEEEEEEETPEEVFEEKKEENDCYIQELEIYLESLNIKLKQVLEEKEREVRKESSTWQKPSDLYFRC